VKSVLTVDDKKPLRRNNMYKLMSFVIIGFFLLVPSAYAECPPGFPVDCGDGWCCPSDKPVCCGDGTCCQSGTYCCPGGCCSENTANTCPPGYPIDCGNGTCCPSGSYCCSEGCCPENRDPCPGQLTCMTYFCGGTDQNPYVCCPPGFPYLNHCDCKCYETTNFDCGSYSKCSAY
jgi:hypothetical protein